MKTLLLPLIAFSIATAGAATDQEVVNDSTSIIRQFRALPERGIPRDVLRHARGLAVIKVLKDRIHL